MPTYHYTTKENAEKILKDGLKSLSFVCRNVGDWHGEICLEIDIDFDNWDNPDKCNWQRCLWDGCKPELIRVIDPTNYQNQSD